MCPPCFWVSELNVAGVDGEDRILQYIMAGEKYSIFLKQDDETLEQLSKEWTPFADCQLIERQVDIIANLVYN